MSLDTLDQQSVFLEVWCPNNISKLQVWVHKSGKQHFHAFPIKILIRSNETMDSVCLVDLLFHMHREFQLTVDEDTKFFLPF